MNKVALSHIAIACSELEKIAAKLQALSLEIDSFHDVPSEKVKVGMIKTEVSKNFRIEVLEPTSPDSPIAKFLTKKPDGGIHHLCFEVTDITKWDAVLRQKGYEVLPPGIRKGARGRVLFIHPKSMGGVLTELEEISP